MLRPNVLSGPVSGSLRGVLSGVLPTGSSPWTPAQLDNLILWSFDRGKVYRDALFMGYPGLEPIPPAPSDLPISPQVPHLELTGADTYFTSNVATPSYPLSMSGWGRRDVGGDRTLFSCSSSSSSSRYLTVNYDGDNIELNRRNAGGPFTGNSRTVVHNLSDLVLWHHYLVTFESPTIVRFFVDGVQVYETFGAEDEVVLDGLFDRAAIGTQRVTSPGWYWDGGLGDFRIYDHPTTATVPTASDITDKIMRMLPHGDEYRWWPCQEGSLDVLYDVMAGSLMNKTGGDTQWGNHEPIMADYSSLYGGRMTSTAFIAALQSGASAADSLALQSTGAVNPNALVDWDPFTDARLSGLGMGSPFDSSTNVSSVAPLFTKFERKDGNGFRDRFLALTAQPSAEELVLLAAYMTP